MVFFLIIKLFLVILEMIVNVLQSKENHTSNESKFLAILYNVYCEVYTYVLRMYVIHISLVSTCPFILDQPTFAIFGFPNLDIFVNSYTAL